MATKTDSTHFYVDIARVDEEERMVYGYGTRGDMIDSHGTVIDMDSVKKCIPGYAKWGNIREMHQNSAVGRADDITIDDKGVYLGVKVVDDQAWKKVTERVYKGFSIGGKKDYQDGNTIYLKEITEFSLVDRPSNEGCPIDEFRLYKGDDTMKNDATTTTDENIVRYAGEEISDARTALNALDTICWLMQWEQSEADSGAHPEAAEQVAQLKAAIENLKKFIISELKENTAAATYTPGEMSILELAAGEANVIRFAVMGADGVELAPEAVERIKIALTIAEPVERAGSRHSAEDMTRLNSMMSTLVELGVTCACGGDGVAKAAGTEDDVQRLATLESDITRLQDETDTLRAENTALITKVETLSKEPAPSKGVLRVISKGEDLRSEKTEADEEETKRIAALPPEQQAIEEIKRAHQHPTVMRIV